MKAKIQLPCLASQAINSFFHKTADLRDEYRIRFNLITKQINDLKDRQTELLDKDKVLRKAPQVPFNELKIQELLLVRQFTQRRIAILKDQRNELFKQWQKQDRPIERRWYHGIFLGMSLNLNNPNSI